MVTSMRKSSSTAGLILALLFAIFAFQLNASMLSPVLATMEQELGTTTARIGLTQTAFFTAAALFSLILPRWGDLVGRRKIMVAMVAVTAIGSIIAALSVNVGMLFVARVVQGVSGPIVPMALIMLRAQMNDDKKYALWMAVLASVNGGIAGVDALAGGWLASAFGFRSVFWAMAAVAVLAVVFVLMGTEDTRGAQRLPMDWPGSAALVVSLGTVLTAFNQLGKLGEADFVLIAVLLVIGAAAFAAFWRIESTSSAPLVATHYLKQRRTWGLLATTTLTMTGVFAIMNGLIPNLAQSQTFAGLDAGTVSWVTLTPYALAGLVFGPVAGRLAARYGYVTVLRGGMIVTVGGIVFSLLVGHPPDRVGVARHRLCGRRQHHAQRTGCRPQSEGQCRLPAGNELRRLQHWGRPELRAAVRRQHRAGVGPRRGRRLPRRARDRHRRRRPGPGGILPHPLPRIGQQGRIRSERLTSC